MKKKIINIPLSAFNLQIVKNKNEWVFEYSLTDDRAVQLTVNKPCEIARIYQDEVKLYVELNVYSKQEFVNL